MSKNSTTIIHLTADLLPDHAGLFIHNDNNNNNNNEYPVFVYSADETKQNKRRREQTGNMHSILQELGI